MTVYDGKRYCIALHSTNKQRHRFASASYTRRAAFQSTDANFSRHQRRLVYCWQFEDPFGTEVDHPHSNIVELRRALHRLYYSRWTARLESREYDLIIEHRPASYSLDHQHCYHTLHFRIMGPYHSHSASRTAHRWRNKMPLVTCGIILFADVTFAPCFVYLFSCFSWPNSTFHTGYEQTADYRQTWNVSQRTLTAQRKPITERTTFNNAMPQPQNAAENSLPLKYVLQPYEWGTFSRNHNWRRHQLQKSTEIVEGKRWPATQKR